MSTIDVLRSYSEIKRELGRIRSDELKDHDFGPKQVMILYRLTASSASMSELTEYTQADKASTTRAVISLERAGLVRRKGGAPDRRITLVELTAKGHSKALKAIKIRDSISRRVNEALTPAERKALTDLLKKLAMRLRSARLSERKDGER